MIAQDPVATTNRRLALRAGGGSLELARRLTAGGMVLPIALEAKLARAQSGVDAGPAAADGAWNVIFSGGLTAVAILAVLVIISVVAVALAVQHLLAVRRPVLMPDGLATQVADLLSKGDITAAKKLCQSQPSALATVVVSGLSELPAGWPVAEKAMEESLADQSSRLLRKIDYLSVIGNIGPMIGLLGTVFGMIFAFQEVANTQGAARAAELASGIYQALVTTVGGLLVAIPSLAAFAIFRNRIDQLIAETGAQAQSATVQIKRALQRGNVAVSPPPPPFSGTHNMEES